MALQLGHPPLNKSPQVRRHVGESEPLHAVLEPDDVVGSLDVSGPDRRLFGFWVSHPTSH